MLHCVECTPHVKVLFLAGAPIDFICILSIGVKGRLMQKTSMKWALFIQHLTRLPTLASTASKKFQSNTDNTNMVYFFVLKLIQTLLVYETVFSCTFEGRGAIQISNHNANKTEQVSKPLTVTVGYLKIHISFPLPPTPNSVHRIF